MVVDVHVHAFPDKIAVKAIETLSENYGVKCFSDGRISSLIYNMRSYDIDVSVVQPVSTDPKQVISINTWIATLNEFEREENLVKPIIGFGTIHPKFEGYREEIYRMKELGIRGVKFQPSFQEFYPDDEKMFPIYEELIKANMIIFFHAGDEIRPAKVIYSTPKRLANLLDAMKNTINLYDYRVKIPQANEYPAKIVAAHLGGYKMWGDVEEYLVGREIYFDLSYVFGHIDLSQANRIMRSHGLNKILYGSDFPFARQERDINVVMGLDISQEDKENILNRNFLQLYSQGNDET